MYTHWNGYGQVDKLTLSQWPFTCSLTPEDKIIVCVLECDIVVLFPPFARVKGGMFLNVCTRSCLPDRLLIWMCWCLRAPHWVYYCRTPLCLTVQTLLMASMCPRGPIVLLNQLERYLLFQSQILFTCTSHHPQVIPLSLQIGIWYFQTCIVEVNNSARMRPFPSCMYCHMT